MTGERELGVSGAGPSVGGPSTGWRRSFERPVRAVYGGVVVITAVFAAAAPVGDTAGWMAGFLAVLLLSAGWVWVRGFDRLVLVAVFVALAVAVLLPAWGGVDSAAGWWAWQPWVTVCVLTGAVCTVGGTVVVTTVSSAVYVAARIGSGAPTATAFSEIVSGWQAALLVCLVMRAWRHIAEVGDRSALAEIAQATLAAQVSAADRGEQYAARTLHDRVLHTLRAATADEDLVSSTELSLMAVDAVHAFGARADDPPDPGIDLAERLRQLAGLSGLDVRWDVERTAAPGAVPEPVCRSLLAAAAEAFRNVRRHAGTASVTATLRQTHDRVELEIVDRGAGFDPARVSPRSRGLVDSVVGAMTSVGGGAIVRSSLGQGTDVLLRWPAVSDRPPQARARVADLMVELGNGRRDLLRAVAIPEAGGGVLRCVLWMQTTTSPAAVAVGGALGLAALVTAAVPIWTGRVLTRRRAGAAALLGVAAIAAAGPALDPGVTPSFGLATVEVVAPVVMMLAWQWRFRTALAVGVVFALTATAVAAGSAPGALGYLPQILLCPLAAVELRILRSFVAADAGRVDSYYRARRLTAQVQADAEAFHRSETRRMSRMRPMVLPTLTALAAGRLDRGDRNTRTALAVLDAAIRDDLQIGDCLSPQTRTLIDAARRTGITVDVTGPPGPDIDLRGHLDPLVELALGGPWRPSSVALTAARNPDGTSTLALLVRPGLPSALTRPTPPVVDTTDLTLLRVQVPVPDGRS
ncbi:MAG: hypothetical protein ABIR83_11050 [Nakamurella sp.]